MIKLLTVVGARPQFIKAAAISRSISSHFWEKIEEVTLHTGQHYDPNMSEVFFEELSIPREKYNLKIGSYNHAHQTAKIMMGIDEVVDIEKPDALLLYGDTNSTLAASLVAIKRHIPIIHIEAGVRSYNKEFPEEVNRLICDHVSSVLFVPSDSGMESLKKEGFTFDKNFKTKEEILNAPRVFRCGDIMYDNTLFFKDKSDLYFSKLIKHFQIPASNYFLVTAHRPSNVDQPESLENILNFFHFAIDKQHKSIIFPMHPRTKSIIDANEKLSILLNKPGIFVIPPVSFIEMIALEKNADIVVTDSGGVQKEAYFMEKPCLIMLEETPWVELIASNNARLVGNDYNLLCEGASHYLYQKPTEFEKLYGDGKSANFICEKIIEIFEK